MAALEAEKVALEAEVAALRKRGPPRDGAQGKLAGAWGNKKDEDNADVEAAILTGGDVTAFQPMSGVFKRLPVVSHPSVISATDEMDRVVIRVFRQPAYRAAIVGYLSVLHVALLVAVI